MRGDSFHISGPFFRRVPARALIVAFGLCVILVAWASVLLRLTYEREDEIRRCYREDGALARAFEEHVRRVVKTVDNALLFLKMEYEKHGAVTEAMKDFAGRAQRDPILNSIGVVDSAGDLVLSPALHGKPINCSGRDHFQVHASNRVSGLHIGKPVRRQDSGTWSFFVSRRVSRPDGSFGGVVSAGLDVTYFSDYYRAPELGEDKAMMLVGADHIVRARHFRGESGVGQDLGRSSLFGNARRESVGHFELVGVLDGARRFGSYRAMPDYPLIITVATLKQAALAPFERRRETYLLVVSGFTLFVAGFCGLLLRAEGRTRLQNERLVQELSERRRAEEALRESESLFSAFMDHLPALALLKDSQGKIVYANAAFRNLFGQDPPGWNMPDPGSCALSKMQEADGRTLGDGTVVVEESVRGSDGRERTLETRNFVIGRADKPPLVGGISLDISERRRAEQERLSFERQMQQAQKMESLGILAGGIAHDFNNLLMAILGNLDLASAKSGAQAAISLYLERAGTAVKRAAELTNLMLAYAGKGRFLVEPIDLSGLLGDMASLLRVATSRRATVSYRLAEDLPPVKADVTQLRQVVMNLITNASEALGSEEGVIDVTTGVVEAGSPHIVDACLIEPLAAGRYAYVEVSDSGCGMDPATRTRIFEPFFTTKQTGRGLGLAAVLGIVRAHGGGIELKSEPRRGTSFKVLLPAAEGVCPAVADGPADVSPAGRSKGNGRGSVLVVDDEEDVRTAAQAMLEECGFTVFGACDGFEALEMFRARAGEIGAVVLDVTMPRMSGEEVLREMRLLDPTVPVIFSSGYHEHEAMSRCGEEARAGFLQKPYRMEALAEKVRSAIAARPRPA